MEPLFLDSICFCLHVPSPPAPKTLKEEFTSTDEKNSWSDEEEEHQEEILQVRVYGPEESSHTRTHAGGPPCHLACWLAMAPPSGGSLTGSLLGSGGRLSVLS